MHTEQEAKERWCPFARLVIASVNHAAAGFNRDSEGGAASKSCCIASQCMAWRWFDKPGATRMVSCGLDDLDKAVTRSWKDREAIPDNERKGFCGLAGAPQ